MKYSQNTAGDYFYLPHPVVPPISLIFLESCCVWAFFITVFLHCCFSIPPPHPNCFYANLDELQHPYSQKIGGTHPPDPLPPVARPVSAKKCLRSCLSRNNSACSLSCIVNSKQWRFYLGARGHRPPKSCPGPRNF